MFAAAGGRALQLTRAGYAVALLLKPGLTIRLATGRAPGGRACRVARLLGARHLAQATLTALAPRPGVFAAGAAADALHAASMFVLAVANRAGRRTALTDAMAEAAFAAAGLAAAAAYAGGTGTQPRRRTHGDGAARRLLPACSSFRMTARWLARPVAASFTHLPGAKLGPSGVWWPVSP
jgi:hypothetical protein